MNNQFEYMNQIIEIALRYYISVKQHDWVDVIDIIQASLLISIHVIINKTLSELLYNINSQYIIDLSNSISSLIIFNDWIELYEIIRKDIINFIIYIQDIMKIIIDKYR